MKSRKMKKKMMSNAAVSWKQISLLKTLPRAAELADDLVYSFASSNVVASQQSFHIESPRRGFIIQSGTPSLSNGVYLLVANLGFFSLSATQKRSKLFLLLRRGLHCGRFLFWAAVGVLLEKIPELLFLCQLGRRLLHQAGGQSDGFAQY